MAAKKQSQNNRKAKRSKSAIDRPLGTSATLMFGQLADGLGIGLGLVNATGAIQFANQTLRQTLGIKDFVEPWRPLQHYITGSARDDFQRALDRARMALVQGKFEIVGHGGDVQTFCASMSRLDRDDDDDDDDTIWMLTYELTELIQTGKALHKSEGSLHTLSNRLMKAQDTERRRMARDLHDTTGQELAVILMSLTQLSKGLEVPGFNAKAALADIMGLVRKVEDEVRTLSYVLHPPMLDELGLHAALAWYVEGFSKRSKIQVDLDIPSTLPRLSRDKEIAVFRVIQECLTNVLRHSGSASARIRAEAGEESLRLYVEDFGKGLAGKPHVVNSGKITLGVGILGMRERLEQLGGTLEIKTTSAGTKVVANVPWSEEKEGISGPFQAEEPGPAGSRDPYRESHEESSSARQRILIADDHELMRRGIQNLLAGEQGLEVCGEATDGLEAIAKTEELHPDLVILDLSMPRLGGFSVAQQIHQLHPGTKILVFTNHSYGQVQGVLRTLGCQGYVSKARASTDLIRGVRAVLGGQRFYDTEAVQARYT